MVTFHKVVGSVPTPADPDAIYLVRVGDGFEMWATSSDGVPFRQNGGGTTTPAEPDPVEPGTAGPIYPTMTGNESVVITGHSSMMEFDEGSQFSDPWPGQFYTHSVNGDQTSQAAWNENGYERNNPFDLLFVSEMDEPDSNGRYYAPETPGGTTALQHLYWFGQTAKNNNAGFFLFWHPNVLSGAQADFEHNRAVMNFYRQWLADKLAMPVFVFPASLYVQRLRTRLTDAEIYRDGVHLLPSASRGYYYMAQRILLGTMPAALPGEENQRAAALEALAQYRWGGTGGVGNDEVYAAVDPLPNPAPIPVDPVEPGEAATFAYSNNELTGIELTDTTFETLGQDIRRYSGVAGLDRSFAVNGGIYMLMAVRFPPEIMTGTRSVAFVNPDPFNLAADPYFGIEIHEGSMIASRWDGDNASAPIGTVTPGEWEIIEAWNFGNEVGGAMDVAADSVVTWNGNPELIATGLSFLGTNVPTDVIFAQSRATMPTAEERQALRNAAQAAINSSVTLGYVNDGDSLTHGYGVTPTYPQRLQARTNLPVTNLGVSGRRLREMDETFESRNVAGLFEPIDRNTIVAFGGANELIHETPTLAILQASMLSYVGKAQTAGYRVFVCTLPQNNRYDTAKTALKNDFNNWIRNTLRPQIAGIVDVDAIPEFANPANTTYFTDGIHLTALGNDILAEAVRVATGVPLYVPTTEPEPEPEPVPEGTRYFTDFAEFEAGNLVEPWQHMPNAGSGNLWNFQTVSGVRKLRQSAAGVVSGSTTTPVDTGAWLSALQGAQSIQFYSEAETGFNNNSSMEWLILPVTDMASALRYRIDYTPGTGACRIRKGSGASYSIMASGTATGSVAVGQRVCCLAEYDGSRVRAKIWNVGSQEPASWSVSYTDPTPVAPPLVAGVHNYSARQPVTVHTFGVGVDGQAAPRNAADMVTNPTPEPEPEPENAELVVNGTFDANIDGWLNRGTGSMSWQAGRLAYAPTNTGQGPHIILNTIPGEVYTCSLDIDYVGGTRGVQVSMNGTGQDVLLTDETTPRTVSFSYVASSNETELFIRNGGSGTDGVFYVDNVSAVGKPGTTNTPAGPQTVLNPETNIDNLPRVFISTDLKMDSPEKDDAQSLIHALMYQDKYNIVGMSATASKWGIQDGRYSDIIRTVNAYELDQAKFRLQSPLFKTAAQLRAISWQGATAVAPAGVGWSQPTDGSRAIQAQAVAAIEAGKVLNVLTWGGETDIAQALHDSPEIAPHIRLFTINKQDDAAFDYIMANFRDLLNMWVDDQYTYGGVWRTNNGSTLIQGFHDVHALGHGALGQLFYEMSFDLHGVNGVKMGDSPTVLRFLSGNQDDPTQTSWGGQFRNLEGVVNTYYTDLVGTETARNTIFVHRQAWLNDFQARFDWLRS